MTEPTARRTGSSAWAHGLLLWLLKRPQVLRAISWVLREWPIASAQTLVLARREAVVAAFHRSADFCHRDHAPNLVAGEFVIGLPDGKRQGRERQQVEGWLRDRPTAFGKYAAVHARRHSRQLAIHPGDAFDLVDDYLAPAVWRTLSRSFGSRATDAIVEDSGGAGTEAVEKDLLLQLRHVGSHLVVGAVAPARVQGRAESAATALSQRIAAGQSKLLSVAKLGRPARVHTPGNAPVGAAQSALASASPDEFKRSSVGLMWVAHPATVQAGANAMMELLSRPSLYRELRHKVAAQGEGSWLNAALRAELHEVVLELLRFRPPFPLLSRTVLRDTEVEVGDLQPVDGRAGMRLRLMLIGALFDPRAVSRPTEFLPKRSWARAEDRYLVFGAGSRSCPAAEHVVQVLVSLLIGLLRLPPLAYTGRPWRRVEYDGPAIAHMNLRFADE